MVLYVKKDQHGAFVYVIEPKYPNDPELDFGKKLIRRDAQKILFRFWPIFLGPKAEHFFGEIW